MGSISVGDRGLTVPHEGQIAEGRPNPSVVEDQLATPLRKMCFAGRSDTMAERGLQSEIKLIS